MKRTFNLADIFELVVQAVPPIVPELTPQPMAAPVSA